MLIGSVDQIIARKSMRVNSARRAKEATDNQ
jgi:hypothetical protein